MLLFPNFNCYLKAKSLIRNHTKFLLTMAREEILPQLQTEENIIFYNESNSTMIGQAYGSEDTKPVMMKSGRLIVDIAESFGQMLQKDIKIEIDKLLEKIDYALVFRTNKNEERPIDKLAFKESFNSEFPEFRFIAIKRYHTFKNYSTGFVTFSTQSINSLKEIFNPMYELHKEGKESEKVKFDNSKLERRNSWIFSKMGRIRIDEAPFQVVKNFQNEILESREKLRIYPQLIKKEDKYKFFIYCGFTYEEGIDKMSSFCNMILPKSIKIPIKNKLNEPQKTAVKSMVTHYLKNGVITTAPRFTEDFIEIDFYSNFPKKDFIEVVQKVQKSISKFIEGDEVFQKRCIDSFQVSYISSARDTENEDDCDILLELQDPKLKKDRENEERDLLEEDQDQQLGKPKIEPPNQIESNQRNEEHQEGAGSFLDALSRMDEEPASNNKKMNRYLSA